MNKNTERHKITAALITFNEEKNIKRTLEKLTWCDEIVIVDSNSTDKTIEICKKFDTKIYTKLFNGYGEQKRFMISKCSNDLILSVDADEVLTDDLIKNLQLELVKKTLPFNAYFLNRRHVYLGKIFNYGKLSNESVLRFFNKNHANFTNDKVHEKVIYNGKIGKIKGYFLHYTVDSMQTALDKENKYTSIAAKKDFEKGKKINHLTIILKSVFSFLKEYFFNRNFLNSKEGFIWSYNSARYNFKKGNKLLKLISQAKQ